MLDLNERVAIALNKLDASSMETMCIREPWGPLVVSSLHSNTTAQGPHGSLICIVSWTWHLTSIQSPEMHTAIVSRTHLGKVLSTNISTARFEVFSVSQGRWFGDDTATSL